jgi:hypothetical protein
MTPKAAEKGTAFRRPRRSDLNWIFTVQTEGMVAKDSTVAIADRSWQINKSLFEGNESSPAAQKGTFQSSLDTDRRHRQKPVATFDMV